MPGGGIMGGGSIPGLGWPTLNAAATGKRGKIRLTVFLCNTESCGGFGTRMDRVDNKWEK